MAKPPVDLKTSLYLAAAALHAWAECDQNLTYLEEHARNLEKISLNVSSDAEALAKMHKRFYEEVQRIMTDDH